MTEINDKIYTDFLNALLEGNRKRYSEIVSKQLKNGIAYIELYEILFKPALYKVGELWQFNKISVATEHLSSAIIESLVNELRPKVISDNEQTNKIIVACIEKEHHQIGIKMVSDVFESKGWDSCFLGANTPTSELVTFAKIIKPDLFAISIAMYMDFPILEMMIQKIRVEFPDTPILIGGQAFLREGADILNKYSDVNYLKDLYSIESYIKKLDL